MILAIATLLFQFAPSVQAMPIAAAAAVRTSVSEPSTFAINLPSEPADADVDVKAVTKAATSEPKVDPKSAGESSSNAESGGVRRASTIVSAQNTQAFSNIRISSGISDKPADLVGVERYPSRSRWLALSVAQHAAAAFDAYSTRDAISHGATEADPLMRPFANASGIYAAIQVMPVALDFTARRMQRSPNSFVRRIWWVPQSVATASFLFSGVHNLHVAGGR
jgi:hypothetical protein